MTKVTTETTTPEPSAFARSFNSSDAVSVGRPVQKKTMDMAPPITIARSSRDLFAPYFIEFA